MRYDARATLRRVASPWVFGIAAAAAGLQVRAQSAAGDSAELAKQLSNPVSDLVSVPFQFNWEEGVGFEDATRMVLNVQPVVPFKLNDDWNLIGRWIMPFVSQPSLAPGVEATFGLSDILFSAFFSPSKSSGLIWGIGPAVSLPSTDEPTLGSGKWAAGPTIVLLKQSGPWTYGVLANQLWSFADASDASRPDVDRTFIQPFLAYQRPKGVTFTLQSETTYDRKAADGDEWTAPINFVVSKVTTFGPFPFSIAGGYGYFVDAPAIGPERKLRIAFTLILPRNK
jgi:hypothetical protein